MVDFLTVEVTVLALGHALRARGERMATAESCTGGLIAAACTSVAGSSDWFERGVVSYSNQAKTALLGVDATLIQQHGAVSEAVARAMALGALQRVPVPSLNWALSVTGIAGPGGGVPGKPVGTVWMALACASTATVRTRCDVWPGDRSAVREATVRAGLTMLLEAVRGAGRGA
jgi:nicotinamide-nucleotide amidase